MTAQADRIGALRFVAVDADGQRTIVQKSDGAWQRPPWVEPARAESERHTAVRDGAIRGAPGLPPEPVAARAEEHNDRVALVTRIEASLNERYLIKRAFVTVGDKPVGHTEYRFRGDASRVAFTESTFRLATDSNSPSVARSMVEVAQTRDWQTLRVSGHEDFRRQVWFEASLRGVQTIGFVPLSSDLAWLGQERERQLTNRIEPTGTAAAAPPAAKASARGSGSRKTVLAAIESVLVAQRVPEKRREAIMAAAADNLSKRLAAGEVHKVKVYDKAAPRQQTPVRPSPEQQRSRDRAAPVR